MPWALTCPSPSGGRPAASSVARIASRSAEPVRGRLLANASRCEPRSPHRPRTGSALRLAIRATLDAAGLPPAELGHVNAHGGGTPEADRIEAEAIAAALGSVPVTAPK
ncbi:MAG: hypothetical protein ACKOK8_16510, partial [Planctomycetia bacterium]